MFVPLIDKNPEAVAGVSTAGTSEGPFISTVNGRTGVVARSTILQKPAGPCLGIIRLRLEVVKTSTQFASLRRALRWRRKGPTPPAQLRPEPSPLSLKALKAGNTGERLPNNPGASRAPGPGIPAV